MRFLPFVKPKNGVQFAGIGGDGGGGSASLPVATSETLGGVKIGQGVSVTEDGTISFEASGVNIPFGSETKIGTYDNKDVYMLTFQPTGAGYYDYEVVVDTLISAFGTYVDQTTKRPIVQDLYWNSVNNKFYTGNISLATFIYTKGGY